MDSASTAVLISMCILFCCITAGALLLYLRQADRLQTWMRACENARYEIEDNEKLVRELEQKQLESRHSTPVGTPVSGAPPPLPHREHHHVANTTESGVQTDNADNDVLNAPSSAAAVACPLSNILHPSKRPAPGSRRPQVSSCSITCSPATAHSPAFPAPAPDRPERAAGPVHVQHRQSSPPGAASPHRHLSPGQRLSRTIEADRAQRSVGVEQGAMDHHPTHQRLSLQSSAQPLRKQFSTDVLPSPPSASAPKSIPATEFFFGNAEGSGRDGHPNRHEKPSFARPLRHSNETPVFDANYSEAAYTYPTVKRNFEWPP